MSSSLPASEVNGRKQTASWWAALGLVRSASPRWTTAWMILLVVQGVLPAALVYSIKLLVDRVTHTANGRVTWDTTADALPLALVVTTLLAIEILQVAIEWVRTAQSEQIQDYVKGLIHRQAATIDLAFFESAEWNDRLYQASTDAAGRPLQLLENLGGGIQNGITLVTLAVMLAAYSVWLPLGLFLSTLPTFLIIVRFDRRYHAWWQRTTADRRWVQYYDTLLTHKDAAAEMRLFGLSGRFSDAYQRLRRRLHRERLDEMRMQSLAKAAAAIVTLGIAGGANLWMLVRSLNGSASLGDLLLLYQVFSRAQAIMRSLLGNVGQIVTNRLYLDNLFEFLALEPQIRDAAVSAALPAPLQRGIQFTDVTFRYPGSERAVLERFNLFLPANRIIAIVGPNGAGKSTLVKLLCRFYDAEAGRIELDGHDLRDFALEDLRRAITVLFQLAMPYHATAAESIALGDVHNAPTAAQIEHAARSAGAHEVISRLPQGYDTLIGKWYANGVELSGGEQQRIALARAYLRQSPIMLLDEPTSFIDSWAEAEWFERFRSHAAGRTAIIITHRFTIARRADVIHVLEAGRLVESGSHGDLVNRGGLYAQSWDAQTRAVTNSGSPDTDDRPIATQPV